MTAITVKSINRHNEQETHNASPSAKYDWHHPNLICPQKTATYSKRKWKYFFTNLDDNKFSTSVKKNHLDIFWKNIHKLFDLMFEESNYAYDIEEICNEFEQGLQLGSITITKLHKIGIYHHAFTDGWIARNDSVWLRNYAGVNQFSRVIDFYQIKGLQDLWINPDDNSVQWRLAWQNNKFNKLNNFVVGMGREFGTELTGEQRNLENYTGRNTPLLDAPNNNDEIIFFPWNDIIQQVYVIHDHVSPTKQQMAILSQHLPFLFQQSSNPINFPVNSKQPNNPNILFTYCGYGLPTNLDDSIPPIKQIKHFCCLDDHPKVRIYSIYQGYIPRLMIKSGVNQVVQGLIFNNIFYFQ